MLLDVAIRAENVLTMWGCGHSDFDQAVIETGCAKNTPRADTRYEVDRRISDQNVTVAQCGGCRRYAERGAPVERLTINMEQNTMGHSPITNERSR